MRLIPLAAAVVFVLFIISHSNLNHREKQDCTQTKKNNREICGTVSKGETFADIFKKYGLDMRDLFQLRNASAAVHRLRNLYPGRMYKIVVDGTNQVESLVYWIDEDNILHITRKESGFDAQKVPVEYEKRIQYMGGIIRDNLISSLGEDREKVKVALQLSDVFAWDIDFSSDLREGDTYKIVIEGYYLDGVLKKYGDILSTEFVNQGETFRAYRYEIDGQADYFDEQGKSVKRAFLKAPLNFRRISSYFARSRFHPILRIYRPHHGLDYSAPAGTPVSAVGEGTVQFAGYKGQYGKLVIIKHTNGWRTYYGHLSKIANGIRTGKKIHQEQVIGRVGSTGLATGPHLHYELRINNKPVNPLSMKMPRGKSIPDNLLAVFRTFKNQMDAQFASIPLPNLAHAGEEKNKKI
ncbi:MAG TPA: peptidoglycan DD-metalloendopeptidase family protein [Thermodesulfovibrionales bacterium]|jgi:murein DD-endopeptidase MepM/ murein hydrolase activator NlpD|nr:peptidoglycan DD-metalloendopeptidase family protein [Thermodesulfovibrionales bacterium]